ENADEDPVADFRVEDGRFWGHRHVLALMRPGRARRPARLEPRAHTAPVAAQLADTCAAACGEPSGHAPPWTRGTVCASARAKVESRLEYPLCRPTRKLGSRSTQHPFLD